MSMTVESYDRLFFEERLSCSLQSAQIVLSAVRELAPFDSVVDVGCGEGTWLKAAGELGASRLVGVDGPWVDHNRLLDSRIEFHSLRLDRELPKLDRCDLVISLEVAEHLPEMVAPEFVRVLCGASDLVLFSAAIPRQGGTGHVNEQWQSYWIRLFENQGFESCDMVRSKLWTDKRVGSWYRQNTILFYRKGHPSASAFRSAGVGPLPVDLVHPGIYIGNLESAARAFERPSLRLCAQLFLRWFSNKFVPTEGRPSSKEAAE